MIEKVFQRLGVDWDQFKVLVGVSIRLDFRSHQGMGSHRRRLSPIFRSLIFYGIMGGSLAGSLVLRTTPFLFSLLTLSYSMAMMAFAVILEFGNTIVNPEDAEILAYRPIGSRTYFLAKLCNLLFYVLLMGSALCLLPSFLGVFVQGSQWFFPFVFYPVAMMANLATASFVVLIYTALVKVMPYERFKDVLAYIQMGFTFLLFLSYQMIPRLSREFIREGAELSGIWLYVTPPSWFAGCVQVLSGSGDMTHVQLSILAVIATSILVLFSFRRISLEYAHHIAILQAGSGTKAKAEPVGRVSVEEGFVGYLARKFLRTPETIAGFRLAMNMIRRDRSVKMAMYPVFGFPLAFLLLAIVEGEFLDPFVNPPFSGQNNMSTMVVFFVFFMVYFFVMGMVIHKEWEASWLFHVAPIASPARFYRGVKISIFTRLILPFFILLGLIYGTQIPIVHGIKYVFSLFLFSLVAFSAISFFIKDFPYSKKPAKGDRIQRFSFLLFVMPFFMLTLFIQTLIFNNTMAWWIEQLFMLLLFLTLEFFVGKKLDRRLIQNEFLA